MNAVHFSSATSEWATPQDFFDKLNAEFNFTLDVCATPENAKCAKYFTREQDGLAQSWYGERVWCNPPYGRGIGEWVDRCSDRPNIPRAPELAVMLLPARTDTRWWHDYVIPYAAEVRFIKGRLKFGGHKNSAPFPSAVVVFR
jgi:phage N-6-adenine-methyltransferase